MKEISNERLKVIIHNLLWGIKGVWFADNLNEIINGFINEGDFTAEELKNIDENLYDNYLKWLEKE